MTDLVITSKQNQLVKYIRALRDKRTREKDKRFVIEGAKFVAEALQAGVYPEKLVISERGENNPLVRQMTAGFSDQERIVRVSDTVMEYLGETDTPQGIMALLKMPDTDLDRLTVGPGSLFAVLDGVQDPGNVGTIIRTADAFGAGGVILTRGCPDLFNAKTLRSTMGSVFHLPVIREAEAAEVLAFLRRNSVVTAVTCVEETAVPIQEAPLTLPLALVFGSEARGVSVDMEKSANIQVKVVMRGDAESLNVAVAAGIVFYEAFRQYGSRAKSNL